MPKIGLQVFSTQQQLDKAVCPIKKQHNAAALGIVEYGDAESANTMGIAINGVAFQFANQLQEDPVYPITVTNEQPLDLCLGPVKNIITFLLDFAHNCSNSIDVWLGNSARSCYRPLGGALLRSGIVPAGVRVVQSRKNEQNLTILSGV